MPLHAEFAQEKACQVYICQESQMSDKIQNAAPVESFNVHVVHSVQQLLATPSISSPRRNLEFQIGHGSKAICQSSNGWHSSSELLALHAAPSRSAPAAQHASSSCCCGLGQPTKNRRSRCSHT